MPCLSINHFCPIPANMRQIDSHTFNTNYLGFHGRLARQSSRRIKHPCIIKFLTGVVLWIRSCTLATRLIYGRCLVTVVHSDTSLCDDYTGIPISLMQFLVNKWNTLVLQTNWRIWAVESWWIPCWFKWGEHLPECAWGFGFAAWLLWGRMWRIVYKNTVAQKRYISITFRAILPFIYILWRNC